MAKFGFSTKVCSEACPPVVESPSSLRFSKARRVNPSIRQASSAAGMASLHHFTKMRIDLWDETAGHDERGSLILDEVGHDLYGRVL